MLSSTRHDFYTKLLEREYEWMPLPADEDSGSEASMTFGGDVDTLPDTPTVSKGYIPPTDFNPVADNPFGGLLDAPLG